MEGEENPTDPPSSSPVATAASQPLKAASPKKRVGRPSKQDKIVGRQAAKIAMQNMLSIRINDQGQSSTFPDPKGRDASADDSDSSTEGPKRLPAAVSERLLKIASYRIHPEPFDDVGLISATGETSQPFVSPKRVSGWVEIATIETLDVPSWFERLVRTISGGVSLKPP